MSAVKELESAEVHCGDARAGTIQRTIHGSRFIYAPDFLARCRARGWGLGFRVPLEPQVETLGVNVHSFFAGLLPEGIRLEALERAVKTSADDLLSLLLAAGSEAVGDVRVLGPGDATLPPPLVDLGALDQVVFADVLAESLDYAHAGEQRPIPGVQPKVSAAMLSFPVRARSRDEREAILKLEPAELPRLVANEHFFMRMARACGLEVADVSLAVDRHGAPGLLVTRFDREPSCGVRLHCEDGCQFLDRYPADKYRLSLKDLAEGVRSLTTAPRVELVKFLRLVAFSYLITNGDLHARNVSLLVDSGGLVRLAPAYDLLATLPYGDRRFALKLQGRDDNILRSHIVDFARQLGVTAAPVERMLDELVDVVEPFVGRLGEIGFTERTTAHLARTIRKRREDLGARRAREPLTR